MNICPLCDGDGEIDAGRRLIKCFHCNGTGKVSKEEYIKGLEIEKERNENLSRSVSVSEYRLMGG